MKMSMFPLALLALLFLFSVPAYAGSFNVSFLVQDHIQLFGGTSATGDTVALTGLSGNLWMPFGVDSGAFEIQVGQLSITTHLTRNLPLTHGFLFFDFPLTVEINGEQKTLIQQLMLVVDNSNDGAILLGGLGTTSWNLCNGMTVDFQFLTSSAPAANDGETTIGEVKGQFYAHPTPVPEPSLLILMGIGISGVLAFGWRYSRE